MLENQMSAYVRKYISNFFLPRFCSLSLLASLIIMSIGLGAAYAFAVYGEIGKKYASVGGVSGFLGNPLNDESSSPQGGRFNDFEHGSIYFHPTTGAHVIFGAIRGKWLQLGWGEGWLGFPTTDELITPDGVGRFNHFRRVSGGAEASIYWTPKTGPVEIYGDIRKEWAHLGWEKSSFGYPVAPERQEYQGAPIRSQDFERGKLWWSPKTGVTLTPDAPLKAYAQGSAGGGGVAGGATPIKQKVFKYCTSLDCDACKRDYSSNGICEPSSQCNAGPNGFACYAIQ